MTPLAPGAGGAGSAAIPMSESRMSMASRGNRDSMAYQNIPSDQYWNEPSRFSTGPLAPTPDDAYDEAPRKSHKKTWIIVGAVLGVLAIAGIVAGVVVSQLNKNGDGKGSGSGSSSSGSGNSTTDLSNPSVFDKDDRLHQSFWAIAYTPEVSCDSRGKRLMSGLTCRARDHHLVVLLKPMSLVISRSFRS
jgi:hypothetical protein